MRIALHTEDAQRLTVTVRDAGGGACAADARVRDNVARDALALHVVITGQAKKAALDRARSLEWAKAPVAAVLEEATVHWAP